MLILLAAILVCVGCVLFPVVLRNGFWGDQKNGESNHQSGDASIQVDLPGEGYAVSSCSAYASQVGAQVLEEGGNAVDAAVAMAYTLAVVEPYASGLGGGGCMVVYDPEEDHYYFYNYAAEAAQSGASATVLVPGFVSGMDAVLEDYGTMDLSELLQPAISYCDGFEINETLAARINGVSGALSDYPEFFQNGAPLAAGDTLTQERLKQTLLLLAQEGADCFYTGAIAEDIAASTAFTMSDLAAYETIKSDAVIGSFQEYEVAAAAAPYSGVTLIQMLEMAQQLEISSPDVDSPAFLSDLERITFAAHKDRVSNVYDFRFGAAVDQSAQVSQEYINELLSLETDNFEDEEESEDTTAITVIDDSGMVVSCTNTLASFFGSKIRVDGFFLNNSGRNFGSGVNAYAAGKRPRSHIAPAILRSDGETIAIASPGGNVIVKVLSSVLIDMIRFDTPPQEAIDKQRLLFKSPGLIYYEIGYDTPLLAQVSGSGYRVLPYNSHSYFGNIAYVSYSSEEGFFAATDIRREGMGIDANG